MRLSISLLCLSVFVTLGTKFVCILRKKTAKDNFLKEILDSFISVKVHQVFI